VARLPSREEEDSVGAESRERVLEKVRKGSREVREIKRGNRGVLIDDVKSSGRAKQGAKPETGALNLNRQYTSNNNTPIITITKYL
jgi:hypothetical protein